MSIFHHSEVNAPEEGAFTMPTPEEEMGLDAIENLFDDYDPAKKTTGALQVRATGTLDGAKWSLSRAMSDAMDSALWRFTQRHGGPDLGMVEHFTDRRDVAFREVRPVVFYPKEITPEYVRSVRVMFSEVFHEGCSLLVNLEPVDRNDIHQGALVTWNDARLFSVRVPFREEGNKLKPEKGWTFWWSHPDRDQAKDASDRSA
jgi:hypothetical protein